MDRDDRKALIGRFVAHVTDDFQAGISGAWGGPEETGRPRRNRVGGEVLFRHGLWKLAAELMTGRDGTLQRRGYYLHGGYRFQPRLEGIIRVDVWDPDTSHDGGTAAAAERDSIVGLNVNLRPSLRFQMNLVHKTFSDDALDERNLLLLNLQTAW